MSDDEANLVGQLEAGIREASRSALTPREKDSDDFLIMILCNNTCDRYHDDDFFSFLDIKIYGSNFLFPAQAVQSLSFQRDS